jgi:hypothetical protein
MRRLQSKRRRKRHYYRIERIWAETHRDMPRHLAATATATAAVTGIAAGPRAVLVRAIRCGGSARAGRGTTHFPLIGQARRKCSR